MHLINGLLALALGFFALSAGAQVANIDFQSSGAEAVHNNDDGVLSNTGGDTWNGILFDATGDIFLEDENGDPTGLILTIKQSYTDTYGDDDATNDLQDTGMAGEGFTIGNLDPTQTYTVAVYLGSNSGFLMTDAVTAQVGFVGSQQTYALPGALDQDYVLFTGLQPFDLGGGVFGLDFGGLDGLLTGVQISGALPEPPAIGCDIVLTQGAYSGSEVITASTVQLANPGGDTVAVEWKVWLDGEGISPISLINVGADGSVTLSPGLDLNLGPAGLTSAGTLSAGAYEIGSRLLDPVTGETLCEQTDGFDVL